jgi:hypothetical protein
MEARMDRLEGKFDALKDSFVATKESIAADIAATKVGALALYVALAAGIFGTMARGFG